MSDSKKAFNTAHTSVPVFYPDELAIVGGKDHLSGDERGPLDTAAPDPKGPRDGLYRPRRLKRDFKVGFVESIDAHGVMEDLSIILREGVPFVEYGQMRTRAARRVNAERKRRCGVGKLSDAAAADKCLAARLPLIALRCNGKKTRSEELSLSRILGENHLRHDDDLETSLELMAQLLDKTENNVELVARDMGVTPQTIKHLMGFNDHATKETRRMVDEGRIGITAAAHLAREKDPRRQNELLQKLLSAPDQTVRRAAKLAGKKAGGANSGPLLAGKRQLMKFKEFVDKERDEEGFYDGVVAMLDLQTTGKTEDKRLAALIKRYGG